MDFKKIDILEQAKQRYPIGSFAISLGGSGKREILHHDLYWTDTDCLRMDGDCMLFSLSDSSWAKSESKKELNYSIY